MKLFWTACLALSLGLGLAGCGGEKPAQQDKKPQDKPATEQKKSSTKPTKTQQKPTKPAVC